uniref:Uncharacterized protein n=1 Tax=Caenorhabditis japonica TaxID=281687 RepID=A0A8R1HXZ7_CAEJA
MKVQPGSPQTNRTLVVKRNQPTSVLDITKEQDGDPDILVIKKVLQVLRKFADYDEYSNDKKKTKEAEAVDLKVEEVEVEEIGAEEKSQERGEVETHPPPAQIDVFDLPAGAIVRMMELPAHMITSEVHQFASSYVEPIKKMDLPDSVTKRMAYYCTLDMIQAGRNRSITDARIISETRPMLKPIRRENLQTIDFWPNHADGALPYSILEDDYVTILQRTNGHLTSDSTTPSVVTIKHLSRRDAEDFDAMPQPFRRFNADKSTRSPGGMRLRGIYRNYGSGQQKQRRHDLRNHRHKLHTTPS